MIGELKPCPFCGSDVELSLSLPIVVRCAVCGYWWQLWEKPKGKGLIDATTAAWNARADQQQAVDAALLTIADEYDKAECLTTCNSYAHDDLCPWVNTGNYIRSRVGTNPLAELQARITELEAEIRTDEYTIADLNHQIEGFKGRIAELEQQLEEARKDAERYRWLRKAGAWESEIGMDMLSVDPGQYDNALDAAMTKENTHE